MRSVARVPPQRRSPWEIDPCGIRVKFISIVVYLLFSLKCVFSDVRSKTVSQVTLQHEEHFPAILAQKQSKHKNHSTLCNAPAAPSHLYYTALDDQSIIIHTHRTHTDGTTCMHSHAAHTRRRYGNRRVFGIQAKGHFYLRMVSGRKDNKGNHFNFVLLSGDHLNSTK